VLIYRWKNENLLWLRYTIDFQKIHFARQQGGDYTVVYLRPITPRNYFSESLYKRSYLVLFAPTPALHTGGRRYGSPPPVLLQPRGAKRTTITKNFMSAGESGHNL
jgi:hypothetical protein